jgi:hypothetical protein
VDSYATRVFLTPEERKEEGGKEGEKRGRKG